MRLTEHARRLREGNTRILDDTWQYIRDYLLVAYMTLSKVVESDDVAQWVKAVQETLNNAATAAAFMATSDEMLDMPPFRAAWKRWLKTRSKYPMPSNLVPVHNATRLALNRLHDAILLTASKDASKSVPTLFSALSSLTDAIGAMGHEEDQAFVKAFRPILADWKQENQ